MIRELAEDGSQVVSERNGKVQRGWLKLQDGENGHGATKRNKQGYGSAKGRSSDEPRNGAIPEKDEPEKPYLKSKVREIQTMYLFGRWLYVFWLNNLRSQCNLVIYI